MPDKPPLPRWVWGLIALGAVMALAGFGVIYVAFQEALAIQMLGELPKRGVVMRTALGEELSVGGRGELVYRHKETGVVRRVWNEGSDAQEPAWLRLPAEMARITGGARRGNQRREGNFSYGAAGEAVDTMNHFERTLASAGFQVRRAQSRWGDSVVLGQSRDYEAYVRITQNQGALRVNVITTEPSKD